MKPIIDDKAVAIERLNAFIKQKNMRQTPERVFLLEKIYSKSSYFDAQTLYQEAKQEMHISRATVYSTLNLLVECRLVVRHNFSTKNVKYEKLPLGAYSYYKVCIRCDSVKAFVDKKLRKSIALRDTSTFSTIHHSLYLYGYCKKCREALERKQC